MAITSNISTVNVNPLNWTLVWSDEFDGNILDSTKWTARDEHGGLYSPGQVSVSNGNLRLKGEHFAAGYNRSGLVSSNGKFKFRHRLVEIRAKWAHADGVRNQMWCQAPSGGDMSMNIEDTVSAGTVSGQGVCRDRAANVSITTLSGGNGTGTNKWCLIDTRDVWQNYHIWQMEWNASKVVFRLDGVEKWSITGSDVPTEELYINLALCLGYCGTNWGKALNTSQLPVELLIDYVRIYQKI